MRALFLSNEEIAKDQLAIEGDRFHHLAKVVRAKAGDEILILDGKGTKAVAQVVSINKRDIELSLSQRETLENPHILSVMIGCPKKDAAEEILRRSAELGIKKIIFFEAEYSPWSYVPSDRSEKIIESALIQSNNFWAPEVLALHKNNLEAELAHYQRGLWFHVGSEEKKAPISPLPDLLCIGPEAGWSDGEVEFFQSNPNLTGLTLKTPILRAEHALSVAAGYALAMRDN